MPLRVELEISTVGGGVQWLHVVLGVRVPILLGGNEALAGARLNRDLYPQLPPPNETALVHNTPRRLTVAPTLWLPAMVTCTR